MLNNNRNLKPYLTSQKLTENESDLNVSSESTWLLKEIIKDKLDFKL